MDFVLKTKDLEKTYRHTKALSGLNMSVPKNSIYGLVGRNGAGKTTLLRVITGLCRENSGSYSLFGVDASSKEVVKERRRIGAMIESPSIFLDLTAEDNLKMQFTILGLTSYKRIPEILKTVGLENTGKKKAGTFSLGMKQRLGIAMALSASPDFLILDEPTNGLDPEAIVEMRELILRLNREMNMTILVSSHILEELSKIATYYGFIDGGRMVKEISAADMERECRKCLRLTLSDTTKASILLDKGGVEYSILDEHKLDVMGEYSLEALMGILEGVRVVDFEKRNENLEGYYMSIVGGGV